MVSLVGTIAESYACRADTVMPAYPAELPVPVLSALYASTAGTAARTFALAADWFARSLNERYDGIAIASRMPRMMMTTRSSMSVKPLSSPASRFVSFPSMWSLAPSETDADRPGALRKISTPPSKYTSSTEHYGQDPG